MEKIFAYCERGQDPSFWAEPVNAITNAAFWIAGALCVAAVLALRREQGRMDWLALFLSVLVIVIGVGSFLFHTVAEPWAGAADVIPILIFMLTAVYTVVRRLYGAPIWLAALAVPGFIGLLALAFQFRCSIEGVSFGGTVGGPCLGGSVGYAPALLALLVAGAGLMAMKRPAGAYVFSAGVVFAFSLTARTLDRPLCDLFQVGDYVLGAHFLWHLLNGVTLYLVTMAVIRDGAPVDAPTRPPRIDRRAAPS